MHRRHPNSLDLDIDAAPHGSAQESSSKAADALREFDYPPVAAVTVSYPLSAVREDRKDASGKLPGAALCPGTSAAWGQATPRVLRP